MVELSGFVGQSLVVSGPKFGLCWRVTAASEKSYNSQREKIVLGSFWNFKGDKKLLKYNKLVYKFAYNYSLLSFSIL